MRNLSKKFWKVGTNPYKYLNNFFNELNVFDLGSQISIDENFIVVDKHLDKINFNSKSTLRQNIIAWEAFGFIVKLSNNNYIKIINENLTFNFLINYSFISILQDSIRRDVKKYRDTIIWKCMHILQKEPDIINKFNLIKTRGSIKKDDLEKEIGKYETDLLNNQFIKKIFYLILDEINNKG